MKTKIFAIVMVLMMISGAAIASDRNTDKGTHGMYLKGGLAYTMPVDATVNGTSLSTSLDKDLGYKLAVGYRISEMFRVEGEWDYQKNDAENINFKSLGKQNITNSNIAYTAYLVNGIVDYRVAEDVGLYGVLGMGYGTVDASLYSEGADDDGLVWKVGFGSTYDFTSNWGMEVGYEYLAFDNIDIGGAELKDLNTHNLVASVIYRF